MGAHHNAASTAATRVFAAINSGDLSCLPECVTSDFVDHGSPFPLPPGPEGYAQILGFVHGVLRIRYELLDTIDTDDLHRHPRPRATASAPPPSTAPRRRDGPTRRRRSTCTAPRATGWPSTAGVRDELGSLIQMGLMPAPTMLGERRSPELNRGLGVEHGSAASDQRRSVPLEPFRRARDVAC